MTNMVRAFTNALNLHTNEILDYYKDHVTNNRANNMGDALEQYVKDLFCGSLAVTDMKKRDMIYSKYFSYSGNSHNPPDFIIKQSDAVEVKKVESQGFGDIQLNSSNPKDCLHWNSTLITKDCKECEEDEQGNKINWVKKDMVYVIGNVPKNQNKLKTLWLLDGHCYSARQEVYDKIKQTIKKGIKTINGVEFSETNELGKVDKVDPLGITNLRIRSMWVIKHPMKVFDYLVEDYNKNVDLQVYCLLLKDKYDKLPQEDKKLVEDAVTKNKCEKHDVKVKNPNNPAKWLDAILLKASITNKKFKLLHFKDTNQD